MKAIGYIRVSTEEQAREGVSLDAQEERIKAYATATGLDLVAVIREEGISGSIPLADRPGGAKVLDLLKSKKAAHVVGLKLDRLFRDAADALVQTRTWDKAGIGLHLIDVGGQTINTGTAMGRMFLTMMAGFAELERNLIAERTAAALAHKKSRNEVYAPVPFGFDRDGDKLVENETEAALVRSIVAMRDDGWSLRRIAGQMNQDGIAGKKGGRWYASTVRHILDHNALARTA